MPDDEGVDIRHPVRGTRRDHASAPSRSSPGQRGVRLRPPHAHPQQPDRRARRLPAARRRALPRPRARRTRTRSSCSRHTMWKKGTRLTRDPSGTPIKASDVTLGSAFHVIPEGLNEQDGQARAEGQGGRAAHAPQARRPQRLPGRKNWTYDGIVAYSKICTHVGCPVALYEQQTHHLLCPCHQSQFDVTQRVPRSSSDRPSVRCRSCPSRSTPRATSSRRATSTNLSARASGSVIEYINRRTSTATEPSAPWPKKAAASRPPPPTTSTSARASRASSKSSVARSSPTTGRSCSARSRSTASSSSCSRARS